ncbi:unnamed protein product [Acanthoscelides obtectus]|uniref:Uncharacterized protein n=1 Tax=Acanthoscelides obtectus TaxID=200917 RepID=A0A9P0KEQ5_ACAOB|nr:unnamed protein product [Acanthoscelides obtectus]CAK1635224.1 hypothetical protein AOBTE_LOCUS9141 [Acanthoscelides obtectus]
MKKLLLHGRQFVRLFSLVVTEKHLFVTFKEHDEEKRLKYASEDLINLIGLLDEKQYVLLELHGTDEQLEVKFKRKYSCILQNYSFCQQHDVTKDERDQTQTKPDPFLYLDQIKSEKLYWVIRSYIIDPQLMPEWFDTACYCALESLGCTKLPHPRQR